MPFGLESPWQWSTLEFYTTLEMRPISRLTGGNWQKWKRVFLTCPCHEIYRDEAVGLKTCKNTWKITIYCENVKFGAISLKFDNFVNNCLLKLEFQKFFCTRVTHIIMIIWSTAHFISTLSIFSYIWFLSNFAFFYRKSPSVTHRSVSQENAYKKS